MSAVFLASATWAALLLDKSVLWSVVGIAVIFSLAGGLWLWCAPGPRCRRGLERARRHLEEADWWRALETLRQMKQRGVPPPAWRERLADTEAQAHETAGAVLLQEKNYEDALAHYVQAAEVRQVSRAEMHRRVLQAMLADLRGLFAKSADTRAVLALGDRVLAIDEACAEALFWQALCHVREGRIEKAVACLDAARASAQAGVADPAFYLGVLHHRQGQTNQALTYLAEAKRLAPTCAFVAWQLGTTLAASGGESLALETLERAIGPQGLGAWAAKPGRAWGEGWPAGSFVRRLASDHSFTCPLLGGDTKALIAHGQLTIAGCQYRRGRFREAVQAYESLLAQGVRHVAVRRGLGLSLARLGRFDDAFTHLQAAYEQEQPKDAVTAGDLALCAIRRQPAASSDRASVVAWALRLLGQFDVRGNFDWASLCSAVLANARDLQVPIEPTDHARLCAALASVDAVEPEAADAYHSLAATAPPAVSIEEACLYCRAALLHGLRREHELILFARVFGDEPAARQFFARRQWDFRDIEFTYLERYSTRQPGRFPEPLGPEYPARGKHLLLTRSRERFECGDTAAAEESAALLVRAAPDDLPGYDWLAYLAYRQGHIERATEVLAAAHARFPRAHWPLVRRAVLEARRGEAAAFAAAIEKAVALTKGPLRAAIAFLGARVAASSFPTAGRPDQPHKALMQRLLEECIRADPEHADARCWLAAIYALNGERDRLAALAPRTNIAAEKSPQMHYLAAVCQQAAGNVAATLKECRLAAADRTLKIPLLYVRARAHVRGGAHAAAAFQKIIHADPLGPLADQARVLLGNAHFAQGQYAEALKRWCSVDPSNRSAWGLDEPLRQTVYLTGLTALTAGRPQEAADLLRQAERLGVPCRPLVELACFKAAQRLLHARAATLAETADERTARLDQAARLLQGVVDDGCADRQILSHLALVHKERGAVAESRAALLRIRQPDAAVWLQLGLLSLRAGEVAKAEQEFARALELAPGDRAAAFNLFMSRLTLGRLEQAYATISPLIERLADENDRRLFRQLRDLLSIRLAPSGSEHARRSLAAMLPADEQRLLLLLNRLERPETADPLMETLQAVRGESAALRQARAETLVLKAKQHFDDCRWHEAGVVLAPLLAAENDAVEVPAAVLNLAGCCAAVQGDLSDAISHFTRAAALAPEDVRIQQNLGLAYEWSGNLNAAETCWSHYVDGSDARLPAPPGQRNYFERLSYFCLMRLTDLCMRQKRWADALGYAQRAQQYRPSAPEVLEKLFALFRRLNRADDARWVQRRLRELNPDEPEYQLLAVELLEVRALEDIEPVVSELAALERDARHGPGLHARAAEVLSQITRFLGDLSEQLTHELVTLKARRQRLPEDERADVDAALEYLQSRLEKLQESAERCRPLASSETQRRRLTEIAADASRQVKRCVALQE